MQHFSKSPSRYCLLSLIIMLSGCGGGGGGSSSESDEVNTAEIYSGALNAFPVKGLHYETETLSGMTDEQGGYQYREGEIINFSLGDTQLGSAPGVPEITPFDWLGITPSTDESELVTLLKRPMISSLDLVLNASSLLLSLDVDANAENGIDLGGAHEFLLGQELEMAIKAKDFGSTNAIQNIVSTLVNRDPVTLKVAADRLYKNMQLTLMVNRVAAFKGNGTGDKSQTSTAQYNDNGNLETESVLLSENEKPIELNYEYDAQNRLTRSSNSYTNQTESLIYEQDRLSLRFTQKNGSSKKSREVFKYNKEGQLSQLSLDADGNGRPESITDFVYSEASEQVTVSETINGNQNESVSLRNVKDGLVETSSEDYDNDGKPEVEMFYVYDEYSRMSSRRIISTDPSIESGISYFEYDDQDRMIRYSVDSNNDDVIDYIEAYGYDIYDNRVAFRRDLNADQQWDYIIHYRFDIHGNRIEINEDSDGNGVIDMQWQAELQEVSIESDWDAVLTDL